MIKVNGNAVTLATLVTVVVAVLAGYMYVDHRFDSLERDMALLQQSMEQRFASG